MFIALLFVLGVVTGGIASVVGFGIGSFLTPVLAVRTGFSMAVAAVALAHFCGSAVRFWLVKQNINKRMLLSFGVLSAAGGLAGALLQKTAGNGVLSIVFGGLMIFAGVSGLLRWAEKVHFKGAMAWTIGSVSGFFGGLVGNQGGLRAAALTGFSLKKAEFVATATAVALFVDICRVPVYVAANGHQLVHLTAQIVAMAAGVVIGTFAGSPLLKRLPERHFRTVLSVLLVIVGVLVAVGLPG